MMKKEDDVWRRNTEIFKAKKKNTEDWREINPDMVRLLIYHAASGRQDKNHIYEMCVYGTQ